LRGNTGARALVCVGTPPLSRYMTPLIALDPALLKEQRTLKDVIVPLSVGVAAETTFLFVLKEVDDAPSVVLPNVAIS